MQLIGPDTLTVGAANVVNDPAQAGGNPSAACQIQNSSPYQLNVLAAGDVLSIQPFFAQTVEISGQPITVTPLAGTSSIPCTVTFVFLLTTAANTGVELPSGQWVETPPQEDGPLTAAAIASAIATQGAVDNLGTFTGLGSSFTVTAKHTYNSLLVVTNTQVGHQAWYVTVANSTELGAGAVFGAPCQPYTVNWLATRAVVACACIPGDVLQINILGSGLAGGDQATVLGMTNGPLPSVRPDGRAYPLGLFNVSAISSGAGSATIVFGPPAPLRIMVKSVHVTGSTGFSDLIGTLNGNNIELTGVPPQGGALNTVFESGLLLDVSGGITLSAGATASRGTITYDLAA